MTARFVLSLFLFLLIGCASTGRKAISPLEKVLRQYESLAAKGQTDLEDRIRKLKVNIRRLKGETVDYPRELEDRYLIVNIPDFRLNVVEDGKTVLSMKVVVGQKKEWQTPLLSSTLSSIILNPKWNVPPGILEKELIQLIRKDPAYLADHNMKVLMMSGGREVAVDPQAIDWEKIDLKKGGLRLVQVEGDTNSLGKIKFLFPNQEGIYLHDTPERKFFGRDIRALSHGCIRLEKAFDLVEYLMRDNPYWTRKKLLAAITSRKNRKVPLPKPVTLHIVYLTAWVDEKGEVNFRDDIYERD